MRFTILLAMMLSFAALHGQLTFEANQTEGCIPVGITIAVTNPAPGTITSYAWTITYPDGSIVTSGTPLFVDILSIPGTYDVSLTINGSETTTIVDYITVHAPPDAEFIVDDPIGCFPHCVNFSDISVLGGGQIVEWAWDFGDGTVSSEQNPSFCYDEPGTYTPVFSIEDEFGCISDYSVSGMITVVDDFPEVNLSTPVDLDCLPPVEFTFTNTSSGSGALTYAYDFGDGNTLTTNDPAAVVNEYDAVGTYETCLTVTDDIGCQSTDCIEVEVIDIANSAFVTVSPTTICAGETVAYADVTVPNPISWSWDLDGDGDQDANSEYPIFTYNDPGTYYPALTVTYSPGCIDTESGAVAITVLEALDIAFETDTSVSCQAPFAVNFTNLTTGPGNLSYEWFIDGVSVSTSADFSWVFNDYASYDIELVVESDAGCSGSVLLEDYIQVFAPEIFFSNPTVICTGVVVDIFDLDVTSVDPVVQWLWDFNEDNVPDYNGQIPDFSYNELGEFSITLDIVTEGGCVATFTSSQTINVQTEVSTDISVDISANCAGDPFEFCIEEQPGVTYSWNFGDNTGWQTLPYDEICIEHEYQDTGYFDVTISVFNEGCNSFETYSEFVYVTPPVALFEYSVICGNGTTVYFEDNSILADSLMWDFGDGSPIIWNDPNPVYTYTDPGNYTVTLTAINDDVGCPDVYTAVVVATEPDPTLNFAPTVGCPPLEVEFQPSAFNHYWNVDFGNGTTMEASYDDLLNSWTVQYVIEGEVIDSTFTGSGNIWPTVAYNDLGTYDITVTTTDPNGCQTTETFNDVIEVNSSPDFAFFNVSYPQPCGPVTVSFDPVSNSLDTWLWTFGDGTTSTDLNPTYTFNEPYPYDTTFTVTLEAYNDIGCGSTVTQDLEIVFPAVANFEVAQNPSCQGDTIHLINQSVGNVVQYSWDFGDPLSGPLNTSNEIDASHIYNENGDYEICLTVENAVGCISTYCSSDAVSIVNPVATFDFDANINNCLFGVQFDNTTAGAIECSEWSFGDGQFGSGISVFHTYPIGVFDLELVVCNEFGCYDTLVVEDIFQYGNVIGPFTQILDTATCAPFTLDLEAFNTADVSFDYFWDFGDGFGDPQGNTTTTHIYDIPGTYCPSLIMTDANGCPVLIECETPVEVDEFTFTTSIPEPICYGDSAHFTIDGGTSYSWLDNSYVFEVSQEEFWLSPPATQDFEITGYYADCEATEVVSVIVNTLPTVTLDMEAGTCEEQPVFDLSGGLPNDNPGYYTVEDVQTATFDPGQDPGIYEIVYFYTDINGCINSDTSQFEVFGLPGVTLSPFEPMCADEPVLDLSGGSPLGGTYEYEGNAITQFDPATGWGAYAITYTFTDANGCVNNDAQDLEINPVPEPSFDLVNPCVNENLEVINTSTVADGNITGADWDFDGLGTSDLFQPDPITAGGSGVYSFSLEITTDAGCTATLIQDFEVFQAPVVAFSLDNACAGSVFVFDDQTTIDAGDLVSWSWEVTGQDNQTDPNWETELDQWGIYDVSLTVVSDQGCEETLTQQLEVYAVPVAGFSFEDICAGNDVDFTNTTTLESGAVEGYQWDYGNSQMGNALNGSSTYSEFGLYTISLIATSDQGCADTSLQILEVFANPEVDFVTANELFCAGGELEAVSISTIAEPYQLVGWTWQLSNGAITEGSNVIIPVNEAGTFDLTLTVWSANGCSSALTQPEVVTVWPNPMANFTYDAENAAFGDPTIQFEDESIGAIGWQYDFGDGTEAFESDPVHEYANYGEYDVLLLVANEFGCIDTVLKTVSVDASLLIYVPNAFTPDYDGLNDEFIPQWSGFEMQEYTFQIWNRWGDLVFETHDPEMPWIGDVHGGAYFAPNDVYTWRLIVLPGHLPDLVELKGSVTLVR
ncbi:MAG: PKD domain-containing protein [Flavobacteriales bacterium]|nr:PKD domain-containing protein [Flavobacteriales bacterium]